MTPKKRRHLFCNFDRRGVWEKMTAWYSASVDGRAAIRPGGWEIIVLGHSAGGAVQDQRRRRYTSALLRQIVGE
ncbi:hypothetical protein ACC760_38850, partial [Rhizobium ruizarguesonis]